MTITSETTDLGAGRDAADPWAGREWATWTPPSIVDVSGTPTAYRRQGSGPTVVYLHPVGLTRAWLPFHRELSTSVDLVAPEHPGFGDTPRHGGFTSWQDWVLHYEEFFRVLDLRDIHLVGDSLGAWLAANLAVTYPTLFRSVTLISPLGLRLPDVSTVDVFRLTDDEANEHYFNGRRERYSDVLAQQDALEDFLHANEEAASLAVLAWNPRYDLKLDSRLGRVKAPTLVLGSDDDRIASNRMAERYAELIPGAALDVIRGPEGDPSGHRVSFEQPVDTAQRALKHIHNTTNGARP